MASSRSIFHVALPVTVGVRAFGPNTFTLKQVCGTAFPLGGGLVLTADHVIRNAQASGLEMLVGTGHRGAMLSHETSVQAQWPDIDIAVLSVDDIADLRPLDWTTETLRTLDHVRAIGFAFGFEPDAGWVVARGFSGSIAAVRPFFDFPSRPPAYELGFAAPSGLSGAALLRQDTSVVCGCIIGNRTTEMNVLSHVETVTQDDGTRRTIERSERHDYLHLGVAIRAEPILALQLPGGRTLSRHVESNGGRIYGPPQRSAAAPRP